MTQATFYHNPACGTSRNTLELLRARGIEPRIVEYLKSPLTHDELKALLKKMKAGARDLLRSKEKLYAELKLDDPKWSEDELIGFIAKHSSLMNRPVVVTPKGARLCRPAETVLELL